MIVNTLTGSVSIPEAKLFNPRGGWMDRVDNDLLYRYWVSRGTPDVLVLRNRGFGVTVMLLPTQFGHLRLVCDNEQ